MEAGRAAQGHSPAAAAAARAASQAASVAHMGAHALGAAAYAVKALMLDTVSDRLVEAEITWQWEQLTTPQRVALRKLPTLGVDRSGPLGPGLLTTGLLAEVIRAHQTALRESGADEVTPPGGRQ